MKKIAAVLLCFVLAGIANAQTASTTLTWSAPGDDGPLGRAAAYEMHYSNTRPDTLTTAGYNTWWAAATAVTGLPVPAAVGTAQSVIVSPAGGFSPGITYYFVIRARDGANNWSSYSNVAWRIVNDTTPPGQILDLR